MTSDNDRSRETIAVIGGGPGSMFFCHALEVQRNELLKRGEDVSGFPIVKCFERAPGPGGVWRADRSHEDGHEEHIDVVNYDTPFLVEEKKEEDTQSNNSKAKKVKLDNTSQDQPQQVGQTPNMYAALWTNGPKEAFEFSDYTFQDHFGDVSMPTFLPRKYVLDYIIARCTSSCPNFFEKYFSFRTTVVNVRYQGSTDNENITKHSIDNKFRVHTRNETTGVEEIQIYDKCIWASGVVGIPSVPKKILDIFKDGGFKGSLCHSSDTNNFKTDVENKRVLIVGGGLSAEDLALMAIKEGVSRIYCTHRGSDDKEMNWTTRWPYDKVEMLPETTIVSVEGNTVTVQSCERDYYRGTYTLCDDDEGEKTVLNDIDTVIFCTGYEPNLNMLDPILRDALDGEDDEGVRIPKEWKMKEDKAMEELFGKDLMHTKPSKFVYPDDDFQDYYIDLYRGSILLENPNMMYLSNAFSSVPLMETDITAWFLAKHVTGQKLLPSVDEMKEVNRQITLDSMDNFILRFKMDRRFNKAIEKLEDFNEEQEEFWEDKLNEVEHYHYQILGDMMNESEYPVRFVCEDGKSLSELGMKTISIINKDYRGILDTINSETENKTQHQLEPGWMTFRDAPEDGAYVSVFTGIKSCKLPKPWFELDENEKLW